MTSIQKEDHARDQRVTANIQKIWGEKVSDDIVEISLPRIVFPLLHVSGTILGG